MTLVSRVGVKAPERSQAWWHLPRGLRVWFDRLIGPRPAPPFPGAHPAPTRGKLSEPGRAVDRSPATEQSTGHWSVEPTTPQSRPGSESYAMTPAGGKLHRLNDDGSTLCGYMHLQMVLVEEPPPTSMLCEWCVSA